MDIRAALSEQRCPNGCEKFLRTRISIFRRNDKFEAHEYLVRIHCLWCNWTLLDTVRNEEDLRSILSRLQPKLSWWKRLFK